MASAYVGHVYSCYTAQKHIRLSAAQLPQPIRDKSNQNHLTQYRCAICYRCLKLTPEYWLSMDSLATLCMARCGHRLMLACLHALFKQVSPTPSSLAAFAIGYWASTANTMGSPSTCSASRAEHAQHMVQYVSSLPSQIVVQVRNLQSKLPTAKTLSIMRLLLLYLNRARACKQAV